MSAGVPVELNREIGKLKFEISEVTLEDLERFTVMVRDDFVALAVKAGASPIDAAKEGMGIVFGNAIVMAQMSATTGMIRIIWLVAKKNGYDGSEQDFLKAAGGKTKEVLAVYNDLFRLSTDLKDQEAKKDDATAVDGA